MFKIKFLPNENEIEVEEGTTIIHAAMKAGVHINASCGGDGVCGKCRVFVEKGEVEDGISQMLTPEDIEKGCKLACKAVIKSDLTVRVPIESTIDTAVLNKKGSSRKTASIKQTDFNQLKEAGLFIAPIEKKYLELTPPNTGDNIPDVSRLIYYLSQNLDEHSIEVTFPVMQKIPDILRHDDFKVTVTILRPVKKNSKNRIINIQAGDTTNKNYSIAMDIGTTTVFGQLIDLITGETLAEYGDFNGQISYGEDVISRIMYTEKGDGLSVLQEVVISTINKIVNRIIKKAKVDPENISTITFAGNTTMTQLLLAINPKYIRRAPYVPASTFYPPIRVKDLGIELGSHVRALIYPQISSYVGGDIVSGVMGSGMYRSDKLTLFIDIGTNAEIVIGNKDWMACAACSAGPAFEGGGIEFGMRASKGAIEDFSISPLTFEPINITIGNEKAKGICGSGLIITVASLFETGVINNTGKFNRELETKRIRERAGIYEYVLAWKDETQIDRDIVLTEIDIENLIRAKGAIYSGFITLLAEVGMSINDLEHIILAGGFGSYIDLEKAMVIGLLPEIDTDKVTFVGNASLLGAKMSSLTNSIRQDVGTVSGMITNFELSETPSYMDNYVAALFLPHTDLKQFPKLKARMESNGQLKELVKNV